MQTITPCIVEIYDSIERKSRSLSNKNRCNVGKFLRYEINMNELGN